jgi:hypothetical protein
MISRLTCKPSNLEVNLIGFSGAFSGNLLEMHWALI